MMRISANVYYEHTEIPNVETCLDELFYVSTLIDNLLGTKKCWYEKGYSRKQALEHVVFNHKKAEPAVVERWREQIKKDHPVIIEGVWDGEVDSKVCSINYIKKHFDNPRKISLDVSITCCEEDISTGQVIEFMKSLVGGRSRAFASINTNGYWNNESNVFPDRICAGWMIYIPAVILPALVHEAAKIVPVEFEKKNKGTIVVSTQDIFDGRNKIHIGKANVLEIRLLDLGLLPLMTEL